MKKEVWIPLSLGIFLIGVIPPNSVCKEALEKYGIAVPYCPSGDFRQTAELEVGGARRGAPARVTLSATAHYTVEDADDVLHAPIKKLESATLALVGADGKATPIPVDWQRSSRSHGDITLPDVPDGDYKLVADVLTKLGPMKVELPMPLYTPAQVHVLTDRPLYEPGNTVQFRAVALRARDLGPLDGRPGRWIVKDPTGEVMLEEKAPAGDWGVVAGTFPLDKGAPTGVWRVAWVSNDATDEVQFTVEPFTLPRFRVEATPDKPFYGTGDTPSIKGAVIYSSGAPVANAKLEIHWNINGSWPPPTEWMEKLLPKTAVTGANGRYELALPKVPADLQGKVTLGARISATDPAGDRVDGTTAVLLSKDGIEATAVTELDGGLVESFNNRLYVRVTTPDGRVVSKAKVTLKPGWQDNHNGFTSELDEDGVASLQIDPGAPTNITIPAAPYRPAPREAAVTRGEIQELIGDEGASLADQIEVDRWLAPLAVCGKYAGASENGSNATIGLRIAADGGIVVAGGDRSALDQCVLGVVRARRLPAGKERLFTLTFAFADPDLPTLTPSIESAVGGVPDELNTHVSAIAASARDCLPRLEGSLPQFLSWRVRAGTKEIEIGGWSRDPSIEEATLQAAMPCVTARAAAAGRAKLPAEATEDHLGVIRFSLAFEAGSEGDVRPQPTTMIGYELDVVADIEGKPSTKLRIGPGTVPDLRMRVTPVIVKPGETVTAQLIRGPEFKGSLPKELAIECLRWKQDKLELDAERKTTVTIDPTVEGWCEVRGAGQRALVYVKPQAELFVSLKPQQPTYRPGQMAHLDLRTQIGGRGGKAAVGLFGVDESLGQLVTLPGPDDMGRVRPKVTTGTPAFGSLDGQALSLGRIRGANAAAATVLRVTAIPTAPELDAVVNARAASQFDPVEELTDHFYIVLAELHVQARAWEAKAPASEKMQPPAMAELWNRALEECKKRGQPTTDAYGRPLRLALLPQDLLALTDPRSVIVVGTRLPEDVENWAQWVARERP